MAVTQRQIAAQLGLSPQAVNFALGTRRDQVSAATRRRVLAAARKLGYRTNAAASAVATGRFNAVGLVMSTHTSQSTVFGGMLRGIHDALDARGVHLAVHFIDDARLTSEHDLPKLFAQAMVDGLLLNYTHAIPASMAELIDRHRLPVVWINSRQPANCVYPDDAKAGYDATRLLLDAGHRRIVFMDFLAATEDAAEVHYSHPDRRAGYERAMREAGLEPLAVAKDQRARFTDLPDEAGRLLAVDRRPTAAVCYSRHDAQALMLAARSLGLRLGPDLSIVMIEYEQLMVGPLVDTMVLPEYEVGRAAADMLMARVADPGSDQPSVAIPMSHKPGETVSPLVPR